METKKSTGFILALVFTFVVSTVVFNLDGVEFVQRREVNIPSGYFYLIFAVDILWVVSLVLIYLYRKLGVFLFTLAVAVHFLLNSYFLSSFLYFDVFILFLYFSLVLLVTVPRWQAFK